MKIYGMKKGSFCVRVPVFFVPLSFRMNSCKCKSSIRHGGTEKACARRRLVLFGAAEEEFPGGGDGDTVGEGPQGLVSLLELFADGEALRTMLFAFAALYALGSEGGLSGETERLGVLEAAAELGLGVHGVVAAEDAGDVDPLGTRHAVAAAGATDLFLESDLGPYFIDQCEVRVCEFADGGFRRRGDVLADHFNRIHSGQDDRHLRLVV